MPRPFYLLEGDSQGLGIGDALWYSIVSITTIGYGDLAPDSMGARIGTAIFIVLLGLSAFTAAIGMTVDWLIDLQLKERTGLGRALARDHLLIVNYPSERRVRQVIDEFLGDPRHKDDEIVVITDKVDSLPFDLRNVHFVRGSPLEEETYSRANVGDTRQAIVLSPGYDDPRSEQRQRLHSFNPRAPEPRDKNGCGVAERQARAAVQGVEERLGSPHVPDKQQTCLSRSRRIRV